MPTGQQFEPIAEREKKSVSTTATPSQALSKRLFHWLVRRADFFTALLLMAFVARHYLSQQLPLVINSIDFFDTSWELDMVSKAHQGIWLGKDVTFTYGPLFQWLFSWAPLRHGMSLGSFFLYLWVFQYWTIILTLYGTGALLLRRQTSWVRVFYLLLLIIFWVPVYWTLFDIKLLFPLFCFAVFLRSQPDSDSRFSNLWWRSALAATLIAVACLISGDAGIYAAAAFAIVAGASLLFEFTRPKVAGFAKYSALTAAFFVLWILTINRAAGGIFDFRLWRGLYEIVTQYRWAQAVRMVPAMEPIFWLAVTLGLAVFAGQRIVHMRTPAITTRVRVTWLAMLGFALVALQSLLVSSEKFHVAIGLFPLIALSIALLLDAAEAGDSHRKLAVSLAVILVLTGILTGPNHLFLPHNLYQDNSAAYNVHACPPGLYEIDGVCLETSDFTKLQAVRELLMQHTSASDSVGIFPYQNTYGFVARRRVAGDVLQHYAAAGDYLSSRQIESLKKTPPPWVVYSAEPWESVTMGSVPSFSRTPYIWLYWQRWYQDEIDAYPGVMLLHRDTGRGSRWLMTSTSLLSHPLSDVHQREKIVLPAAGADWDFIKIDLQAEYPWWWKFGKPSGFVVGMHMENGEDKSIHVIVQPNHPYEVWLYPWENAQLANYFSPNAEEWRARARPRVQSLWFEFWPVDLASVVPSRVTVRDIQVVKLAMQPAAK
jgi:hypothetical protein